MPFDANTMKQTIEAEVQRAVAAGGAGAGGLGLAAGAGGVGQDFCNIWPKAKPILELLAGIATVIPGVGAVAGGVLQGLIKVADQIFSQTCPAH